MTTPQTISPPAEAAIETPGMMAERHRQELDSAYYTQVTALKAMAARIERELAALQEEAFAAACATAAAVLAEEEEVFRPFVRSLPAGQLPHVLADALDRAAQDCPPDRAPVVLLALHRPLTGYQAGRHDTTTGGAIERLVAVVDVEQARVAQRVRKYGPPPPSRVRSRRA